MNAPPAELSSPLSEPCTVHTELIDAIVNNVCSAFLGKSELVRMCASCILAEGHLLIEDVPGVGKTTLAKALAKSIGLSFGRIQFTADMLPSDILGVSIFEDAGQRFVFQPGPIFHNVILADEINRASPRTQSALLEAMHERRVTVDNTSHALERPFLVIATQNPTEFHGTYPLPESQLDRFALRLGLGFPQADVERSLLKTRQRAEPVDALGSIVDRAQLIGLMDAVDAVHVDDSLIDYLMLVVEELRNSPRSELGVSTRASLMTLRVARALALSRGRDYVLADELLDVFVPAFAHRLRPTGTPLASSRGARQESERLVRELVGKVALPR